MSTSQSLLSTLLAYAICQGVQAAEFPDLTLPPGETVPFEQQSTSILSRKPTTLSGLLSAEEDRLTMEITSPKWERRTLDGTVLAVERRRGDRTQYRSTPLDPTQPQHRILLALRQLLQGDYASLEVDFALDYSEVEEGWSIRLDPNEKKLAKRIQSIVVSGQGTRLQELRAERKNGTWLALRILPAPTDTALPDATQ